MGTVTASHKLLTLQALSSSAWAEERLLGDLWQSVPQNGRVHLHIIEKLSPATLVTGLPGRVSGQEDLCSLGSEDSASIFDLSAPSQENPPSPEGSPANKIYVYVSNSLMGSFGKGSLPKIFCKFPRNFPRTFRRISAPFPDAIKRILCKFPQIFRRISANFPQKTLR